MPGYDGTGPRGQGSMTGGGFGPCGRGGRRGFGRGFGRGYGRIFYRGNSQPVELTQDQERKVLETELELIETEKVAIGKRLKELKA